MNSPGKIWSAYEASKCCVRVNKASEKLVISNEGSVKRIIRYVPCFI